LIFGQSDGYGQEVTNQWAIETVLKLGAEGGGKKRTKVLEEVEEWDFLSIPWVWTLHLVGEDNKREEKKKKLIDIKKNKKKLLCEFFY